MKQIWWWKECSLLSYKFVKVAILRMDVPTFVRHWRSINNTIWCGDGELFLINVYSRGEGEWACDEAQRSRRQVCQHILVICWCCSTCFLIELQEMRDEGMKERDRRRDIEHHNMLCYNCLKHNIINVEYSTESYSLGCSVVPWIYGCTQPSSGKVFSILVFH